MDEMIPRLLESDEPSVRYKIRVGVLGEDAESPSIAALRRTIKKSPRVALLLSNRSPDGRIAPVGQVYKKWIGAHWVLASLADIGYPPGDSSLRPAVDQVVDWWLRPEGLLEWVCEEAPPPRRDRGVPIMDGRARRCASQQGNALFAALALGFADERTERLADCLLRWQWDDGGWNCDRRPEAVRSSFWESLIPLRALARYAAETGNPDSRAASRRAAEVFLQRRLYRRLADGGPMNPQFTRLHYPCYWRYDVLFALKVMTEAGLVGDPRCADALDLLESKRLPDGGWAAQERFYRTSSAAAGGRDLVDWGPVGRGRLNEWVTADVLVVLKAAGRLTGLGSLDWRC